MNLSYRKPDVCFSELNKEHIMFPESKELELMIKIFRSDK